VAKTSGIPSQLLVGIYDLSGDTGALEINTSVATINVTSIADSATSKIVGRRDGSITVNGFFNVVAGQQHPVESVLGADEVIQWIGAGVSASILAKRFTYAPTLNEDGSITVSLEALGNGNALEWGELL
jgi:hypothetical protein